MFGKGIDIQDFVKTVTEAKEKAIERGIDANTILLNERLRYVPPLMFKDSVLHSYQEFPPMILGLELRFIKLPDGYDFALYHAEVPERERRIAQIQAQAVREFAEKLKGCFVKADDTELYPHYSDGYNRALEAVNEIIDSLLKAFPCCITD